MLYTRYILLKIKERKIRVLYTRYILLKIKERNKKEYAIYALLALLIIKEKKKRKVLYTRTR